LCEFVCDHFGSFENKILNVGCESGNVKKVDIVSMIQQYHEFSLEIIEGKDLDTRDYNVRYEKLKSLWENYDENFPEKIESIVGYYKKWKKS
jgi:hypothetical protein